jgi:purine-binding chemotaxis protein CheW
MDDDQKFAGDPTDRAPLMQRLALLERELSALRRELDDDVAPPALPSTALRVLLVRIGTDSYAIPIESIVEIIRYVRLTLVPEVAAGIVGALNLRGSVHAVLDARRRFGITAQAPKLGTSIVLVRAGRHNIGLLVDRVLEVILLQPDQLEAAGGPLASSSGIAAIATVGAQLVQLIHVDALLQPHAMQALSLALESIPAPEPSDTKHGAQR